MPRPTSTTHDEAVSRLAAAGARLDLNEVADAFLAGLASAPPRFRTPLARAGFAVNVPPHPYTPSGPSSDFCAVCGLTRTLTVREDGAPWKQAHVALLDLEDFVAGPKPTPTAADLACFDRVLDGVAALSPEARATDLIKHWSKVVPRTNAWDRRALLSALSAAGVLETLDHPGRLTRWVGFWEDEEIPSTTGDLGPPEAWWRGADGVNRSALDELFPHLDIDRDRFSPRAGRAIEVGPSSIIKGRGKGAALEPGDVVGIQLREPCFVARVLGFHRTAKKTLPVLELFDAHWSAFPDPKRLRETPTRRVGPFRRGARWRREPLVLDDATKFPGLKIVRLGHVPDGPAPLDAPLPEYGYRVVATRNLGYLFKSLAATTSSAD
jgi:hypothetical protein